MAESGRTSDSGPPGTKTTFLNGKIDQALQKALGLENRPEIFNQIIQELQKFADQSFRFTMPIFPQETALVRFVEKAGYRYGACYMAHKSGYFESHGRQSNTTRRSSFIKIPSKNVDNAQYNPPKRVTRTEAAVSSDAMLASQAKSTYRDWPFGMMKIFGGSSRQMAELLKPRWK
ncbi:hypothetical protein C8R44DRAFT_750114 [Mycena epipterygia]|nr:hypothetical protein C8R44DRAFT_750114 [Mycena epipterygia]